MNLKRIVERHFLPCLRMLEEVITGCPPDLWPVAEKHAPVWQHAMHTLEGIDYFFTTDRLPYLGEKYKQHIPFDFTEPELISISQPACQEYYRQIKNKALDFINIYGQELPAGSFRFKEFTVLDLLLVQVRHIQYHVGYCSSIFSGLGFADCKWLGYGES
jgi:hypothetical protein